MKKFEHKPLSFSTTMRNPERIAGFLKSIKEFDGEILTSAVINQIVKNVIKEKLYKPMYISRNKKLNDIYLDENKTFSEKDLEEIIENSSQNHKEAGFPKGWASRFDTWYKLIKEFGFVFYNMNQKIEVSASGYMLCDAYEKRLDDLGEKIQSIFCNALMKYQTNNPFRRNLNDNAPIPLLLNLLQLLKADEQENGAGVYRKELPFFSCWPNNDANELYKFIKAFRKNGVIKRVTK